MHSEDPNIVILGGNLTNDVERKTSPGGVVVANYRIGVNGRRKEGDQWVDKPNFFSITTFGKQAENDAKYLGKGRPVLIHGRLDWSEWQVEGEEHKRQGVKIIPSYVKYLPSRASIEELLKAGNVAEATAGLTEENTAEPAAGDWAPEPGEEPVAAGWGPLESEPEF